MSRRSPTGTLSARQNARLKARIKALRQVAGLSTRELAKRAGVGVSTVRSVGMTNAGPTLGTLMALARALGLASIDELLGPSALALMDSADEFESRFGPEAGQAVATADIAPRL